MTVENFDTGEIYDLSVSGLGFGASAGMQYFVSPVLALDGGVSIGMGKMGNVKVDGRRHDAGTPDNTTTTRIRFGANWYPRCLSSRASARDLAGTGKIPR
jgi:hypothetical protein